MPPIKYNLENDPAYKQRVANQAINREQMAANYDKFAAEKRGVANQPSGIDPAKTEFDTHSKYIKEQRAGVAAERQAIATRRNSPAGNIPPDYKSTWATEVGLEKEGNRLKKASSFTENIGKGIENRNKPIVEGLRNSPKQAAPPTQAIPQKWQGPVKYNPNDVMQGPVKSTQWQGPIKYKSGERLGPRLADKFSASNPVSAVSEAPTGFGDLPGKAQKSIPMGEKIARGVKTAWNSPVAQGVRKVAGPLGVAMTGADILTEGVVPIGGAMSDAAYAGPQAINSTQPGSTMGVFRAPRGASQAQTLIPQGGYRDNTADIPNQAIQTGVSHGQVPPTGLPPTTPPPGAPLPAGVVPGSAAAAAAAATPQSNPNVLDQSNPNSSTSGFERGNPAHNSVLNQRADMQRSAIQDEVAGRPSYYQPSMGSNIDSTFQDNANRAMNMRLNLMSDLQSRLTGFQDKQSKDDFGAGMGGAFARGANRRAIDNILGSLGQMQNIGQELEAGQRNAITEQSNFANQSDAQNRTGIMGGELALRGQKQAFEQGPEFAEKQRVADQNSAINMEHYRSASEDRKLGYANAAAMRQDALDSAESRKASDNALKEITLDKDNQLRKFIAARKLKPGTPEADGEIAKFAQDYEDSIYQKHLGRVKTLKGTGNKSAGEQ
jgi:hypothetical protein